MKKNLFIALFLSCFAQYGMAQFGEWFEYTERSSKGTNPKYYSIKIFPRFEQKLFEGRYAITTRDPEYFDTFKKQQFYSLFTEERWQSLRDILTENKFIGLVIYIYTDKSGVPQCCSIEYTSKKRFVNPEELFTCDEWLKIYQAGKTAKIDFSKVKVERDFPDSPSRGLTLDYYDHFKIPIGIDEMLMGPRRTK